MRVDVHIGVLQADARDARPGELAAAVERELSRSLAGRHAAAGAGGEIARAVHTALQHQGVPGVRGATR